MNQVSEIKMDEVIQHAVEHHGGERASVIPILSEINETFGYIPLEALGKIRRLINTPEEGLFLADSHLYATASFYSMFSVKPWENTSSVFARALRVMWWARVK